MPCLGIVLVGSESGWGGGAGTEGRDRASVLGQGETWTEEEQAQGLGRGSGGPKLQRRCSISEGLCAMAGREWCLPQPT